MLRLADPYVREKLVGTNLLLDEGLGDGGGDCFRTDDGRERGDEELDTVRLGFGMKGAGGVGGR